ncbi:unnamed protein product [Allacma fusca]|uniref:Uncharacterized protein n=1 Tax=Allacma fusca TaxID=39272 RepID=A0A8J2PNV4_9HEXA|nr:unnamed protein product [Allacma fusca]
MVAITAALIMLRALFLQVPGAPGGKIAAYIIPSGDAHHSEYVSACDERRAFITGFDGSAGTAVVTQQNALLWTDSRYFIQAEQQLKGTEWVLMKQGELNVLTLPAWLVKNLNRGDVVGVDPSLYSKTEWDNVFNELRVSGLILFPLEGNLIDKVWADQPECSKKPVTELDIEFAGKSVEDKLAEIRSEMNTNGVDILVVSELDEVAWLLNLRGEDIDYNPFFFAYVIILKESFEVFIDPVKVPTNVSENLVALNGVFFPYEAVADTLEAHAKDTTIPGKIWLSKNCNFRLVNRIPPEDNDRLVIKLTPLAKMKAIKNDVETQGMINAHIRDGAAVVEYFAWLEEEMMKGTPLTEISAATQLEQFRKVGENFRGLSFGTISASGENAALPHYSPTPESNRPLNISEIYLVDSGGQYLDGTTDVTRTIFFGEAKDEIKDAFTRVLKGMISLRTAIFPKGSVGSRLDTLARKSLWDAQLDFGHGTGHGIGAYGGVHEGPFSIGGRTGADDPGLQINMFTSDEPGFYKEGDFGIRTENIIRVVSVAGGGNFVTFDDVTLVPIQVKLIKLEMLTLTEIGYLNTYHARVSKEVGKYLEDNGGSQRAIAYLAKETQQIDISSASFMKVSFLAVIICIYNTVDKFL